MNVESEIAQLLEEAFTIASTDSERCKAIIRQAITAIERSSQPPPPLCCQLHPMCEHVKLREAALNALKIGNHLCKGFDAIAKRITALDLADGVEIGRLVLNHHTLILKLASELSERDLVILDPETQSQL